MNFSKRLPIVAVVFTVWAANICLATEDEKPANVGEGSISVEVTGHLNVVAKEKADTKPGVTNPFEVMFATVEAGGMKIAIDHNDCPVISDELANQFWGGAIVSSVAADITGQLQFVPFSRLDESKHPGALHARQIPGPTLVPVVKVHSLRIRFLPHVENRDRPRVTSTTFRLDDAISQ